MAEKLNNLVTMYQNALLNWIQILFKFKIQSFSNYCTVTIMSMRIRQDAATIANRSSSLVAVSLYGPAFSNFRGNVVYTRGHIILK
jgi:hypothetical protein